MPHGPCGVTQQGVPMPVFGQNCGLQVLPAPAVPPTEASGVEPPPPPPPLPEAPALPEIPPAPDAPKAPDAPASPDAPDAPPVPNTPPAPPVARPESFFPPPAVTSSSP